MTAVSDGQKRRWRTMSTSDSPSKARLRQAVSGAVLRGDFTLASGKKSTFYLDGKQVTLSGPGLYELACVLLEMIGDDAVEAIGGLTMGADPIAAAVATLSAAPAGALPQVVRRARPLHAFIVRKDVKQHGTGKAVEGPPLRAGERVVVVDDVITTGGSTIQAIERIREAGAVVARAFCLVDREEGGHEALAKLGVKLEPVFSIREFV